MRWCSLQTNEHDIQAIMYPIVCKYHRLNNKNGNKVPVFPGYICNRWQNMIVQPSQTHNHGKICNSCNLFVYCLCRRLWTAEWTHMWPAAGVNNDGRTDYLRLSHLTTLPAGVNNNLRCIHKGLAAFPRVTPPIQMHDQTILTRSFDPMY